MKNIPYTAKEIQKNIEKSVVENFILLSVPELLFWELGIEYIGNDISLTTYKKQKVKT